MPCKPAFIQEPKMRETNAFLPDDTEKPLQPADYVYTCHYNANAIHTQTMAIPGLTPTVAIKKWHDFIALPDFFQTVRQPILPIDELNAKIQDRERCRRYRERKAEERKLQDAIALEARELARPNIGAPVLPVI